MRDPGPPAHGGQVLAAAMRWRLLPEQVLDFSANLNPLGPPPAVLRAVRRGLGGIRRYPEAYARPVAGALAAERGLPPGAVAVTNGGVEAMDLLARAYRDRRVLVPAPAFGEYARALRAAGAEVMEWRPAPAALSARAATAAPAIDVAAVAAAARGCAAVWLGNPNNPTAALIPAADLRRLADTLAGLGARLVVDEAFIDFLPDPAPASVAADAAAGRLIVIGSLTKFYALPGLRLGYIVAGPGEVARLDRERDPWSVGALAQAAALAALPDAAFAARTRAWLQAERGRLAGALAAVPGLRPLPGAANFILVDGTATGRTAWELQERLGPLGILIRDCRSFGLPPGYFRVAVRRRAENRRLAGALHTALKG